MEILKKMIGKLSVLIFLWLTTLTDFSEPILVTYGTSKGPIQPKQKNPQPQIQPRILNTRNPAPVTEYIEEDLPNPSSYHPPIPHQYRTKLCSVKPVPNLILGTALDQKYTPNLQKYELNKKQYARSLDLDYTGPHIFDKQEYELYEYKKKKTTLQPSVRYTEKELLTNRNRIVGKEQDEQQQQATGATQQQHENNNNNNLVPEIGIVYSSGVRYYVPQVIYMNANGENGKDENSVYDKDEVKYFIYNLRK